MLYSNLYRLLSEKGIVNTTEFLRGIGFTNKAAWWMIYKQQKIIKLAALEKLCIALKCTPNDLLHWVPNENDSTHESHPLYQLKRKEEKHLIEQLKNMPIDQMREVKNFIAQMQSDKS